MKIAAITCDILSTARRRGATRYEDTAGLKFPQAAPQSASSFPGHADTRHLCVSGIWDQGLTMTQVAHILVWYCEPVNT